MEQFKNKYSFNKRKDESESVIKKYPDRIPIIVQKHSSTELPDVDKCKYLVPKSMISLNFHLLFVKGLN